MRVMVAYCSRLHGEAALAVGASFARRLEGSLLVVSVVHSGIRESSASRAAESIRQIRSLDLPSDARELDVETREIVTTRPTSTALLEVAREWSADLLVCGIRERTPVGKAIMGSVSQDLILAAPCPVLSARRETASRK